MAAARVLLGLGWWLAVPSGMQEQLRPSLSLHPGPEVALGDTVTLRCHLPQSGFPVLFYKEGDATHRWYQDAVEDVVELPVTASTWARAGRYRCRYENPKISWASEPSDAVELVVLDPHFSPPAMSLRPEGPVRTGTNVTIRCQSGDGATFVLHKAGRSAPLRRGGDNGRGRATFVLLAVTPADAGTYGCSYRPWGHPFVSSHPRAQVTLEVAPGGLGAAPRPLPTPSAPPGAEAEPGWRLAVVGGCAAALVLVLVLVLVFVFLAAARCRGRLRGKGPTVAPSRDPPELLNQDMADAPPQDLRPLQPLPWEDAEGLTYAELRPPAPGAPRDPPGAPPAAAVVYAEVGGRGPR